MREESTQVMLMDEGYKVVLVCDGISGVKKYKDTHSEITFLDLKMPGIDGFETFDLISNFSKISLISKVTFCINHVSNVQTFGIFLETILSHVL